jgi:hypothetical protein
MFEKGPFVIESFVTITSFDYDYTHLEIYITVKYLIDSPRNHHLKSTCLVK